MRIGVLALALCTAVLSIELSAPAAPLDGGNTEPISIDEIRDRGIQGKLGLPLGKAVAVEGVVFDGATTANKNYAGRIWLDVERVDGKPLTEPLRFKFDLEAFYPHGVDEDDEDLKPIMIESHGDRFKYVVYETGGLAGHSPDIFLDFPVRAGPGWRFETHLVIVRDLAKANESP